MHQGLLHDLDTLIHIAADRRQALRWLGLGGAMATPLAGCGGGDAASAANTDAAASAAGLTASTGTAATDASTTATTTTAGASTGNSCSTIPSETAGPYPGDGTNTSNGSVANALALSGIIRSDIMSSIAGATGMATGIPLTIELTLVNSGASMACSPLAGFAVYLWHCDALGRYSMYSSGVTAENYLRGVQVSDSAGKVRFTTIVPGCYSGRWPHVHFEVYSSQSSATRGSNAVKTSQLALPADVCRTVYATSGYSGSAANLAGVSLASDGIFGDGSSLQLATVIGSVAGGYAAALQVGVAV